MMIAPIAAQWQALPAERLRRSDGASRDRPHDLVHVARVARDEQRTVFQPVGVAIFLMTGFWLGGTGLIGLDTPYLFVIGSPVLLAGLGSACGSMRASTRLVSVRWSWACC